MSFEVMPLKKENYEEWDMFCLESDEAWFWHTTKYLDYSVAYGSSRHGTNNCSFIVTSESKIMAICPLLLEKKIDETGVAHFEFSTSASGGEGIIPVLRTGLAEDRREKILKLVFEKIDSLAKEHNAVRASFRMSPIMIRNRRPDFNWLLKYGYYDRSLNSRIIDLTRPLDHIWRDVRKGHKYDINRGSRYYKVHLFDRTNANKEVFDQYRFLHHKAAGRITRPIETFEMMYRWIAEGNGVLCGVSKDAKFAAFALVVAYKDGAYYISASDDPDLSADVPMSHVIQWEAIKWLKNNGIKNYEIGIQQFGPLFHDMPTEKDMSISFFKRGFGGKTVPLFRGEKFYDSSYMQIALKRRSAALVEAYKTSRTR